MYRILLLIVCLFEVMNAQFLVPAYYRCLRSSLILSATPDTIAVNYLLDNESLNRSAYYQNRQMISLFSAKDGRKINDFRLSGMNEFTKLTLSHDLHYVLGINQYSYTWESGDTSYSGKNYFEIRNYSLAQNKALWKTYLKLNGGEFLSAAFSADNKEIICVTSNETISLDAASGAVLKKNSAISSITKTKHLPNLGDWRLYSISTYGRFFAYWENDFFITEARTEMGLENVVEYPWYWLRCLYHFGQPAQYIYVWDVLNDKLIDKIRVGYNEIRRPPIFTTTEDGLIISTTTNIITEYSTISRGKTHENYGDSSLAASIKPIDINHYVSTDYSLPVNISQRHHVFAEVRSYKQKVMMLFLINYENGALYSKLEDATLPHFSNDGKYLFGLLQSEKEDSLFCYDVGEKRIVWSTALDIFNVKP